MRHNAIEICGTVCTVEYSAPGAWAHGGMGRSSEMEAKILLRSGMPADVARATLIHEVLHMIGSMNGIEKLADDEGAVSVLAHALHAILKRYNLMDDFLETSP